MKLIVGLGNPGKEHSNNRHNVGHKVIDALDKHPQKNLVARKTDSYINESGIFVKRLVEQYRVDMSDLWVIHDDLDIPFGSFKIQQGRGPKIHKGLMSIDRELGTDEYWHVRIGVDNRSLNDRTPGEEYVLEDFNQEELKTIGETIEKVIPEILKK